MRRIALGAAALALTLVASGCADDDAAVPVPDASTTTTGTSAASDSGPPPGADPVMVTLDVAPTPHSPIAAVITMTASAPVAVSITATSGDHVVRTPTTADTATAHVLPLVGLRAGRTYDITVEGAGTELDYAPADFTTGTLPYPLPSFAVTVDDARAQPGVTIVEYNPSDRPEDDQGGQMILGLDHEGEVVFWYRNTGSIGAVEPTERGTFISHAFPTGVREFDVLGRVTENWQVAPEPAVDPSLLRRADALAASDAHLAGNAGDPDALPVKADWVDLTSFHHEGWPMPDGNILALSTTNHPLSEEQRARFCPGDSVEFQAVSDVIVEFEPDGRVVRTWDLWDVIDIDAVPGPHLCSTENLYESETFRDWTHANAVIYDPERDAIIVSSRHTDQILALDHLDAEGPQSSVRWIIGQAGTMPVAGDLMYHPHAVELQDDGSILLYDNGNLRPGTRLADGTAPGYSRAVLYRVDDRSDDPADWTATQVWQHVAEDLDGEPVYAFFLGDADRLPNGNVLINHGGIRTQDEPDRARLIEVVPNGTDGGDIVWELHLGVADDPAIVYRAERLPSLYFGPLWESS